MSATKVAIKIIHKDDESRLAKESAKLNRKFEQAMADEGLCDEKIQNDWNKESLKRYKAFKSGNVKVLPHVRVMRAAYQVVTGKPQRKKS
jgi:hypothetical protein